MRIARDESLARCLRVRPDAAGDDAVDDVPDPRSTPEQSASEEELGQMLVRAIDGLPEYFRLVFVLRAVQGLSVAEAAELLDLNEETTKTRFHRARILLRNAMQQVAEPGRRAVLPFPVPRCDLVVAGVLRRLGVHP